MSNQKKFFRKLDGGLIDVVQFCQSKCVTNTTLYVGTDSVVQRDRTMFVTVVAVRYGKLADKTAKGATFVYLKKYTPRHKEKLERLKQEADITMEMVAFLEENYIPVDVVEFDYNSDPSHASNKALSYGKGWAEGMGYNVSVKPDEQVAVKAADHFCGKKSK